MPSPISKNYFQKQIMPSRPPLEMVTIFRDDGNITRLYKCYFQERVMASLNYKNASTPRNIFLEVDRMLMHEPRSICRSRLPFALPKKRTGRSYYNSVLQQCDLPQDFVPASLFTPPICICESLDHVCLDVFVWMHDLEQLCAIGGWSEVTCVCLVPHELFYCCCCL